MSTREIAHGWTLTATAPGACGHPGELAAAEHVWTDAVVPGTVAAAVGPEDPDTHPDYDASDWWYRCTFSVDAGEPGDRHRLRFDGLATLAEVWLNGERVLASENMFVSHAVDVTERLEDDNELFIVFRSLVDALSERRARPRWKTRLVDVQQLRWFRTTLLGRIPGWTPAIKPVGPWRPIWFEEVRALDVEALSLHARARSGSGEVAVSGTMRCFGAGVALEAASLSVCGEEHPLTIEPCDDGAWRIAGAVTVEAPDLWWPATHGSPTLHPCRLLLRTPTGPVTVDCGNIGFREVEIDRAGGRIRFVVNGVPVFCRGACWTTNDIVSLVGSPERMRDILTTLAEGDANMVRVGGTMAYETEEFYRTCDELGLMVWQDFMFANMDYPVDDEGFVARALPEIEQQIQRLAHHPSVVAFCGGSEVEQQAAMFGAPREIWTNRLFAEILPAMVEAGAPGTPYWPSTPTGGALPFHVGEGLAHYYGVGAYRRPLDDVRTAGIRFTPECLGFSHVPCAESLTHLGPGGAVPPHHPEWKRGVPRDSGTGWDFEDIRDHYLERLYGLDAVELRGTDLERYLELSRLVTGEVMAHVFSEWRRDDDPCGGALAWFLNDLRPGAGWGLIDAHGRAKPVLHYLRRSWGPRCVRLLDRGLDGLRALLVNEAARPFAGALELLVVGQGGTLAMEEARSVTVPERGTLELGVDEIFGHFLDATYAYRFGPPRHEAVVARLLDEDGTCLVSQDVHRPIRARYSVCSELGASVRHAPEGLEVTLASDVLLHDVRVRIRGYRPLDDHFFVAPRRPGTTLLVPDGAEERSFRGYVEALNLPLPQRLPEPA